ncbi:MAG: recombination mediator RecR [Solirubrobacterales bacterium]
MYAAPVQRLITELSKLPGIGTRTAQRLAFHILRLEPADALALAEAITEVKEKIGFCTVCFNLSEGETCTICSDERRDASVICVVEEPGDIIPVERTHEFRGRYHVLGGALSPIDGIDPSDLRIDELYRRVEKADPPVTEVVLATNPTTTGEATALHLARELHERSPDVAVTRLASGLPVGADLEYADEVTLGRAMLGRRAV